MEEKLAKGWKKVQLAIVACIPAIISGLLTHWEGKQNAEERAAEVEKKAEAGYLVTRSAYEQMIKDIATLKAELRAIYYFVDLPSAPISTDSVEDEGSPEGAEAAMKDVDGDGLEAPEFVGRGHGSFRSSDSADNDVAETMLEGFPEDLDMAQKSLAK